MKGVGHGFGTEKNFKMVVRPFPGWRRVPSLSPDPEGGRERGTPQSAGAKARVAKDHGGRGCGFHGLLSPGDGRPRSFAGRTSVHREPFTSEEVTPILEAARKDEVLRGPVHVACFTALSNGMPEELVRRVTGHSAVDVVRKHYYRPNQETFRREFARVADGFYQTGEGAEDLAGKLRELLEGMNGRNWRRVRGECLELTARMQKTAGGGQQPARG